MHYLDHSETNETVPAQSLFPPPPIHIVPSIYYFLMLAYGIYSMHNISESQY